MRLPYFFTLLLLASNTLSFTQETIVTDRPDQTESSSTVPKKSLQIESGILVGFTEGNTRQLLAPTTLFRLGITNGVELRLLNQFESIKSSGGRAEGISDLEIGTKIQILKKETINTEIAFLSHLIVPSGSRNLRSSNHGSINKLSISHVLSDDVNLGYNIGYNYFGRGNGDLTYSVAIGFGITDKLGVYAEPYGDITEFKEHLSNFDAGFTYLVTNNLQLDFSFGTGVNYEMNYISAGASWIVGQ